MFKTVSIYIIFCACQTISTCPYSSVVNAFEHHVQWSMTRLRNWVQRSVWACLPSKELFQIIPKHMMNSEITEGKKKGFGGVLYNLWLLLTPWVAVSKLLAPLAWLKLKGVAGQWLQQHTAPVRVKPDGRPRLEGACYKYPTTAHFLLIAPPPYTSRIHIH